MKSESIIMNISDDLVFGILKEFNAAFNPEKLTRKILSPGELAQKIDHTLLKPDAAAGEIKKLCGEALEYKFGSVCCNPFFVPLCKELLRDEIRICSVIGFPLGASKTEIKRIEASTALSDGAKEIDMVLNIGMLKEKNYGYVFNDISSVAEEVKKQNGICKVILETCLLSDEEKINACLISKAAGADFVKTSTGFGKSGANIKDVALMKSAVGDKMKIKASGGIKTREDAELMIAAGADRIGTSSGVKIIGSI
ncbi:MAG TPA: deoxyribose-phosphate aldolase [Ignavibacteriaceae bacterium]|nr:deoxyribose-phosphate aldolase [Ignavibacteriaceae bacterium]